MYQVKGGYPLVEKELTSRGFVAAKEGNKEKADFIFTAKIQDVGWDRLLAHQMANHFLGITQISLKSRLVANLGLVAWRSGLRPTQVAPLSYCLPEVHGLREFEWMFGHIEVALKVQKPTEKNL